MRIPNQSTSILRNEALYSYSDKPRVQPGMFQWIPPGRGLYFCWGWDDDFNTCRLFWGTKKLCESLTPCIWGPHQITHQIMLGN